MDHTAHCSFLFLSPYHSPVVTPLAHHPLAAADDQELAAPLRDERENAIEKSDSSRGSTTDREARCTEQSNINIVEMGEMMLVALQTFLMTWSILGSLSEEGDEGACVQRGSADSYQDGRRRRAAFEQARKKGEKNGKR